MSPTTPPTAAPTPGPWARTNLTIHTVSTTDRPALKLARVYDAPESDGPASPEEATANARLLAAAPELRAALAALYEHCAMVHKHWGGGSNQEQANAAIAAGRALLARLEGSPDGR